MSFKISQKHVWINKCSFKLINKRQSYNGHSISRFVFPLTKLGAPPSHLNSCVFLAFYSTEINNNKEINQFSVREYMWLTVTKPAISYHTSTLFKIQPNKHHKSVEKKIIIFKRILIFMSETFSKYDKVIHHFGALNFSIFNINIFGHFQLVSLEWVTYILFHTVTYETCYHETRTKSPEHIDIGL